MLYSRSRFSCELSEIGAAKPDGARLLREAPAAFGRLCVETLILSMTVAAWVQPPSGGCVLKLKDELIKRGARSQPPSGGCVLKPSSGGRLPAPPYPAAFGRLCVETYLIDLHQNTPSAPAAFGRLCVETTQKNRICLKRGNQPPSGGCVLKPRSKYRADARFQPAAFGRLCVETLAPAPTHNPIKTSRLRAAVC